MENNFCEGCFLLNFKWLFSFDLFCIDYSICMNNSNCIFNTILILNEIWTEVKLQQNYSQQNQIQRQFVKLKNIFGSQQIEIPRIQISIMKIDWKK